MLGQIVYNNIMDEVYEYLDIDKEKTEADEDLEDGSS
jgi:uncharacterized protein YjaG (DUF416 family)